MGVLLALSSLTRLLSLTSAQADFDETVSWYHIESVLLGHGFWDTFAIGVDAPLYPAINLAVIAVLGTSVDALRVPSALFGIGSVLIFYRVVLRLHSRQVAFGAGLLAALSPFFIYYAKVARPYSQLLFFSLLFTSAFFATESWRPWRRTPLLGALTCLAVASHYYALVYFASFYAIVLVDHFRHRRFARMRQEFGTGMFGLVCLAPLLRTLADALQRLPVRYWEPVGINLATVTVEQLLFTGSLGTETGATFTAVCIVVFALLLLPIVGAATRRVPWPRAHPVLTLTWLVCPLLVVLIDLVVGGDHLFFPRGFIASAPFLFSYLVICAFEMPAPRWLRSGILTLLLLPFALGSFFVVVDHPGHVKYAHRWVMPAIVDEVRQLEGRFDLVVTHHWFVAPYFIYFFADREGAPLSSFFADRKRVVPAGMWHRGLASERGEPAAAIAAIDELPDDARLLVIVNAIASRYTDPDSEVLRRLRAERPLELTRTCLPSFDSGVGFLCEELLIFGAKSAESAKRD